MRQAFARAGIGLHTVASSLERSRESSRLKCSPFTSTACAKLDCRKNRAYDCYAAFARSSTALSSTLQPAVKSPGLASSISLWLIPPTQGTKIIALGATRAM